MSRGDFWSRRRAAVEAEAEAEVAASREAEQRALEARQESLDDEELLQELGLPDPDTLETPEAVRDFMNAAVPARLRNRALRRLWRMNPVLANVDGLVDYGGDFTDKALVVENLQTAYQVGKGMLRAFAQPETDETADDAPEADAPEAVEPPAEDSPADDATEDTVVAAVETPTASPTFHADPDEDSEPEPRIPASSRRMRFAFDPAT